MVIRAYKLVEVWPDAYSSLVASMRRFYEPNEWYCDGPFFLYRDLETARDEASAWAGISHLAIFAAECEPFEPQPKFIPALFTKDARQLKKWRKLLYRNPQAADEFLFSFPEGIFPILLPSQVIVARRFRLLGEPLMEREFNAWRIRKPKEVAAYEESL
jgi:hypothetical protein